MAAEANHTKNKKLGKNLDRIFGKITVLLDKYTDEPPQTLKIEETKKTTMIGDQAIRIAEWTAQVLAAAEQMKVKTKVVDTFVPGKLERTVLSTLPAVTPKVRKKMDWGEINFTVVAVAGMLMAVAEELPGAATQQQVGLLMVAKNLMDSMQRWVIEKSEAKVGKKQPKSTMLYQFKITLMESMPPIWRRIQVQDCTLEDLHEHIQTAMGWTNSHLHQFEIGGETYGDPELLHDDVDGTECIDSTRTLLSEIVPGGRKKLRFKYEYDFGDGWEHEILFEGCPAPEKGKKYPLCLEGERACPPEDYLVRASVLYERPVAMTKLGISGIQFGRYISEDKFKEIETAALGSKRYLPPAIENERMRVLRLIDERRGQSAFRANLIAAFQGKCAVTGCDAVDALEAAHIDPYSVSHSNEPSNGLLLRSDIHTLFDLDLIGVNRTLRKHIPKPGVQRNRRLRLTRRVQIVSSKCPHCKSNHIIQLARKQFKGIGSRIKRSLDLAITPSGIKRIVIECRSPVHECQVCDRNSSRSVMSVWRNIFMACKAGRCISTSHIVSASELWRLCWMSSSA